MQVTRANANTDWTAVQDLLRDSFAYMDARLGHPARAATSTPEDLVAEATRGRVYLILDETPVACLFTRPSRDHPDALYIGKLAVAETHRGQGLARQLVDHAATRARKETYKALTLDTATQFPELHAAFARMGFGPPAPRKGEPGVVTLRRAL